MRLFCKSFAQLGVHMNQHTLRSLFLAYTETLAMVVAAVLAITLDPALRRTTHACMGKRNLSCKIAWVVEIRELLRSYAMYFWTTCSACRGIVSLSCASPNTGGVGTRAGGR